MRENPFFHDYDFRLRALDGYAPLSPTPNAAGGEGCLITDEWEIVAPRAGGRLTRYYTRDLAAFLADALNICVRVRYARDMAAERAYPDRKILFLTPGDDPEARVDSNMAAAFRVEAASDHILVIGKTERGAAQGAYHIEEALKLRGDGRMPPENALHAPLFSPRMTHSGAALDTFPDAFLAQVAHAGMDAIIVYAGHPDMTISGFEDPDALWPGSGRSYCDFAELAYRAEGYGLDVYVYSHIKCDVYPDAPEAEAYYEASFGTLFRKCPNLKGIIFVGETFEFPSKDPHTAGVRAQLKPASDRRPSPGWYPCFDYPLLLDRVKRTIRKYSPAADIVFWTYNWGYAEKDARLRLIRSLPRDISLLVTFDMWETFTDENGEDYRIDDYSISFPGPSQVFIDEAEEAHRQGLRLYTMCNTGGRTWDSGAAPYLPAPRLWIRRYEGLRAAHDRYGLSGLMESHHYGWLPSFLTSLSRNAFMTGRAPDDAMLASIARRDWGRDADKALEAWERFSRGLEGIVAAAVDQYGPYRAGPAYPLTFDQEKADVVIPSAPWAIHGGDGIWNPIYPDTVLDHPGKTLLRLRRACAAAERFEEGLRLLEDIPAPHGSERARQIAVARFLKCTFVTAANVMAWTACKRLLMALKKGETPDCARMICSAVECVSPAPDALAERMRQIAQGELENTALALTCWREDSSIGYEPTMEYVFDDTMAAWKADLTRDAVARLDRWINQGDGLR